MGSIDSDGPTSLRFGEKIMPPLIFDRTGIHYVKDGRILTFSEFYIGVNGWKAYDFDPKNGVLTLDSGIFTKGELEKRLTIEDAVQFVVDVPLEFDGINVRVPRVRKIEYTNNPAKVPYQEEFSVAKAISKLFSSR